MRPTAALQSLALVLAVLAGTPAAASPPEDGGGAYLPGGSAASFTLSFASADRGRLYEAHAGLGVFAFRDFSLSLEGAGGLTSFREDAPHAHTWQTGLDLAPRWHFHRGLLGSLFADAGLGFRYFGHPFPPDGSHFNYALRAGLGLQVNATRAVGAAFGVHFLHLSSPASRGEAPGYDAVELYLGSLLAW